MDKDRMPSPADTGTDAQWAPIPDDRWALQDMAYLGGDADDGTDAGLEFGGGAGYGGVGYGAGYAAAGDGYGAAGDGYGNGAAGGSDYGNAAAVDLGATVAAVPGMATQGGAVDLGATVAAPGMNSYNGGANLGATVAGAPVAAAEPSPARTVVRRSGAAPLYNAAPSVEDTAARHAVPVQQRSEAPARRGRDFDWQPPERERKRSKHGCLSFFLWLAFLVVAGFMALRCLPASMATGRAVPELASFVPLMIFPLVPIVALALLWRRRLLAVLSIAALAVMGYWHYGYFIPTATVTESAKAAVAASASTEDSAARIMTLNTANGAASAAEVVQICREQNVEVLCLQELGGTMLDDLEAAGIDEVLPYHVVSDAASEVNNGGRNGIWTAAPMSNISYNLVDIATSSMPAVDITVGSTVVRVVSVHPNSPVRGAQDLWSAGLQSIQSLGEYSHNYLIMGDFNSTWDHARFRKLLGTSFVDAGQQAGEGFHMTYPSNSKIPSLIEIDHIVYSRGSGIVVSELETIEISGSDHQALLGTLETR